MLRLRKCRFSSSVLVDPISWDQGFGGVALVYEIGEVILLILLVAKPLIPVADA